MIREDPLIRRLQIGALVWGGLTTGAALVLWPGRWDIAAGTCGGVLLAAVSFFAITSSIDAILGFPPTVPAQPTDGAVAPEASLPERRAVAGRALLKLVGRYGLLALLAYVMIARLRLHPVGLVVGASSLVASASFEAARWVRGSRPGKPRAN